MSDYISRIEAAKIALKRMSKVKIMAVGDDGWAIIKELLDGYTDIVSLPSSTVACKDCKYNSGAWRNGIWCKAHRKGMHNNDYCSRGKRRE